VLDLGCRRQDVVGVPRGIRQQLLVDDREQILPAEALEDEVLAGRDRGGVAGVDDQRLDRRLEGWIGQRPPELHHVDLPDRGVLQLRHLDRVRVERLEMEAGGEEEEAAAAVPPGAGQRGEAADRAEGHPAVRAMLHADQGPDQRGSATRVGAGKTDDLLLRQPGEPSYPLRRVFGKPLPQLLEAQRVALDVVGIVKVLGDDHLHHPQRKRRVRPG